MNPGLFITRNACYYSDAPALMFRESMTTYGEFELRSNRLVNALQTLKIRKGDRVAVQSTNRPEIVETEIACYKGGYVKVPINARYSVEETIRILNDSGTKVVIGDRSHIELLMGMKEKIKSTHVFIDMDGGDGNAVGLEEMMLQESSECLVQEVSQDDLAVLAYSSGTSGELKAIMQTFGNRMAMIRKAFMIPEVKIIKSDIFAHVGPITHASGMLLMPVMVAAGCNLILERFNVQELLEVIGRKKVNYIFLVPAMINMILTHPNINDYDLSSLKGIFYGAAPMSAARIKEAIARFGPILVQGYGLTESTSFSTILTAGDHLQAMEDRHTERLFSCGRPIFESELKIADNDGNEVAPEEPGEIIIRGPDVMKGYYRKRNLTRETLKGGWLHTGDIARRDNEGYIYIIDRKSDMIISGGFNIFPSEIEQALDSHDAVYEACVIGVPDDVWGEAVKAVVVLRKGMQVSEKDLIEYCGKHLAGFKKPRSIDFVDSLPRNPNGKIARRVIREHFWHSEKRQVH
jgi:acyl-CoA synthetase (AMP-forming)/AMP-acid ligase II